MNEKMKCLIHSSPLSIGLTCLSLKFERDTILGYWLALKSLQKFKTFSFYGSGLAN